MIRYPVGHARGEWNNWSPLPTAVQAGLWKAEQHWKVHPGAAHSSVGMREQPPSRKAKKKMDV